MSRSRKKTYHSNWVVVNGSNKVARSDANKKLRRRVREILRKNNTEDGLLPVLREVSDVWSFPSDGLGKVHGTKCPNWAVGEEWKHFGK